MKLSISSYSLSRWQRENQKTIDDVIAWIGQAGVDAIEFSGIQTPEGQDMLKQAARVRELSHKHGLAIAGYSIGAEFLVPPAEQRKLVEEVKKHVRVAAELGVRNMRHDVTRGPKADGPKLTQAQVFKQVVPAVREIAEFAQPLGVITTLENHGFYLQTAARVGGIIKAVNHPNYRLTMDMGNFLCLDQDPVDAVRKLAKLAVMVHIKDFHVRSKKNVPATGWFNTPTKIALRGAIVGHGDIDIPAQLRLLKKAGYKGYLSLEFEGIEDPPKAIQLGLDYIRRELKAINALG